MGGRIALTSTVAQQISGLCFLSVAINAGARPSRNFDEDAFGMIPLVLPDIGRLIMGNAVPAFFFIFASLLIAVEIGRRSQRREAVGDGGVGVSLMDGAVFALLGLLVAFSFSAAASRFETRRDLITAEANAIGTARLRLDLLAEEDRDALNAMLVTYVQGRVESYSGTASVERFAAELAADRAMQDKIWQHALAAARAPDARPTAEMLLLPALNEMFDITTTRAQLLGSHNPPIVYVLLWGSALVAGLLAGRGISLQSRDGRLHELGFALVLTLALYVVVDFDYPRLGLIRVDGFDRVIASQV